GADTRASCDGSADVCSSDAVSFGNIVSGDVVGSLASVNTSTLSSSGKPVVGSYTQTAGAITGVDSGNYSFAGFTSLANYDITKLDRKGVVQAENRDFYERD